MRKKESYRIFLNHSDDFKRMTFGLSSCIDEDISAAKTIRSGIICTQYADQHLDRR